MVDGITQTDDGRRLYPRLAAIVAAAATSPRWGVHDRALRAYADELLPTVLGGEWELDKGISAQPSPDYRNLKRFIGPLRHIKWVVYCKARGSK
jgi:hypothetical protein